MLTELRASTPSTAAATHPATPAWRLDLPRQRWHRPLLVLAVALTVLSAIALVGYLVDSRELLGRPLWEKPLKFAISGALYALTWAWIIGHFDRWRRVAWWAGTVITVTLAIELVIIVGFAAAGMRSHFMVDTPLATTAWAIMASAITTLWVATLIAGLALWRNPGGDPARRAAIRAAVVISLIGMGLGFLMTSPTAGQLADFQGIAGAHTVGLADGGPGLPLLGWSTVAGDLRIPHFIGMHALQAILLLALGLELAARRVPILRDSETRRRLILVGASAFLAVVGIVTQQALRGQSIVAPDALTLLLGIATAVLAAAATVVVLVVSRARDSRPVREP